MRTSPIGHLDIALGDGALEPERVRVVHTPGAPVGALLTGRPRDAAVTLVPAMLNLCAAAHRRAAIAAVGLRDEAGRASAISTEIPRDHALAILRDWPAALGLPADGDGMREIGGMSGARDPAAARAALRRRLFGSMERLEDRSPRELARWLTDGETATARLLAEARTLLAPLDGLPPSPAPGLDDAHRIATDRAAAPIREASWLHRVVDTPMIECMEEREGRGPFTRLLARLLDLSRYLDAPEDADTGGSDTATTCPKEWGVGWGVGRANASRGPLTHLARLEGDVIADYHVVTPTDWNAAPGGPLERALRAAAAHFGRKGGDPAQLVTVARLIIVGVDPCVPTTLTVAGRAATG